MKRTTSLVAALALALLAAPAAAQMQHDDHAGHGGGGHQMEGMDHGAMGAGSDAEGPAARAFRESNARMHAGMDIPFSGNTDVDFVRGMIAHHQGAIDMARIELEYGKDPQIRALAEAIIKAQETEIAEMKAWLAKNGG